MRFLVDSQVYDFQTYGGISRYYTEIFSNIKENFPEDSIDFSLLATKNVYFNESNLINRKQEFYKFIFQNAKRVKISLDSKIVKKNRENTIKKLKKGEFDVFIPTYYDPYFLEYLSGKPFVLSVYDMIHELFPQYFENASFNERKRKKILIERADKIIAVSHNTKKDILRIYPDTDASKIEVIYHSNSLENAHEISSILPDNYILYVGNRLTYKNFGFFIKSIKSLLEKDRDIKILCAGGGNFSHEELSFFKDLNISDQIVHFNFNDNELSFFYKNAICFVFPSMYEGFGIPVLEAMSSSCPIVLGKHSSFKEVAGDAGVFFDINSQKDLLDKVSSLVYDKKLREKHIQLGLQQNSKFSWTSAAKQFREFSKR